MTKTFYPTASSPPPVFGDGGDCPHCGAMASGVSCVANGFQHTACSECLYCEPQGRSIFRQVFGLLPFTCPRATAYAHRGDWIGFGVAWLVWFMPRREDRGASFAARAAVLAVFAMVAMAFAASPILGAAALFTCVFAPQLRIKQEQ